ncbi:unnamed protein product (macronuclear) [Paramecium tetraurelia]|uniref:Myb-like DNA-binding domain protein n=1 Tax=Paramecium tetraurelia TaxID=5888 RepID=A0E8U3_PARTE|nr:uncharacterized protein GSPATT00024441001 [Paramecium tetraurelia]CAK91710.1 unnamed protein product [Paramecium tetraurelia]|eukprot:XP_001459107.1 hypothetical protein (macronuclear) [Paramecium tetraurelia strain d4-2]
MQTRNWDNKKHSHNSHQQKDDLNKQKSVQQLSDNNRNFFSNFLTFYEQTQDNQIQSIEYYVFIFRRVQEQLHVTELFTNQQIFGLQEELSKQWVHRIKKNWSEEDKQILIWIVLKICSRDCINIRKIPTKVWEEVELLMSRRTIELCKNKWNDLLKLSLQQTPWTQEQDEQLIQLINQSKEDGMQNKWCKIANLLNKHFKDSPRTGKQCRERWNNHLNPEINRHPWNIKEDIELLELVKKKQKKWALISKILKPKRSENAVKNRYNCLLKKNNCQSINVLMDILKKKYQSENPAVNLQTVKKNKLTPINQNQFQVPEPQQIINTVREFSIQQFEIIETSQLKCLTPAFYDSKTQSLYLSNKSQLMSYLSNQMIKIGSEQNVQNFDHHYQQHDFSNQISGILNIADSSNYAKCIPSAFAQPIQQEEKSQFNIPGVQNEQINREKPILNTKGCFHSFFASKLADTQLQIKFKVAIDQEENNLQLNK